MRTRSLSASFTVLVAVVGLTGSGGAQAPSSPRSSPPTWKQSGHIPAWDPSEGNNYGHGLALSGDGRTLAVGARLDSSAAAGINANEADTSVAESGAVRVYRRSGTSWVRQAYIKASNPRAHAWFGSVIALSADGNTLAVSAPYEDSTATGVNGTPAGDSVMESAGAVYVFTRTGSTWSQQAYLKASNTGQGDEAGYSISLSDDGNTLAVGAIGESSSATGINGNQADDSAGQSGAVYVFTRSGGRWSQEAYVKGSERSSTRPGVLFGYSVALNGNADTMAVGEYDADRGRGAIYVFTRSAGAWSQQARLQASNAEPSDSLGYSVAISDDGHTIAAGAADEDCPAAGVNPPGCHKDAAGLTPAQVLNTSFGAAYIFVRSGSTWTQQAFLKASNPSKGDWFGVHLDVSGDGNTVAVCAPSEDSAATGVNGRQDDESADVAGAVYVFTRNGAVWTQHAYVKGSDTQAFGEFGSGVSLTRDGGMMGVKGLRGSGSTVAGGDKAAGSSPRAGAVYLFDR